MGASDRSTTHPPQTDCHLKAIDGELSPSECHQTDQLELPISFMTLPGRLLHINAGAAAAATPQRSGEIRYRKGWRPMSEAEFHIANYKLNTMLAKREAKAKRKAGET